MTTKPHTTLYRIRNLRFTKVVRGALLLLFCVAVLLLVTNKPYPVVQNYYLKDNSIAFFQYHRDFWDGDEEEFNSFFNIDGENPYKLIAEGVNVTAEPGAFGNNFGMMLVAENGQTVPIYFFEINSLSALYTTKYPHAIVDNWLVVSPEANVLSKVKFHADQYNFKTFSLYHHPNFRVYINWETLPKITVPEETLSTLLLDSPVESVLFTGITQHIPSFVTGTEYTGDVTSAGMEMKGTTYLPTSNIVPANSEDSGLYTVHTLKGGETISIHDPINRLVQFQHNLSELHNIYSFSLNNYETFYDVDVLEKAKAIRRFSMGKNEQQTFFELWVDTETDWQSIINAMFSKSVEERTVILADGTQGKELVRTIKPIEFTEDSFMMGTRTYYFTDDELAEGKHVFISETPVGDLSLIEAPEQLSSEDLFVLYFTIESNTGYTAFIESETNLNTIQHSLYIKKN